MVDTTGAVAEGVGSDRARGVVLSPVPAAPEPLCSESVGDVVGGVVGLCHGGPRRRVSAPVRSEYGDNNPVPLSQSLQSGAGPRPVQARDTGRPNRQLSGATARGGVPAPHRPSSAWYSAEPHPFTGGRKRVRSVPPTTVLWPAGGFESVRLLWLSACIVVVLVCHKCRPVRAESKPAPELWNDDRERVRLPSPAWG